MGAAEIPLINSVVIVLRAVSLLDRTQWIFLSAEELSDEGKAFRLYYLQGTMPNLALALNVHILPLISL